jgi:hypothetical protein
MDTTHRSGCQGSESCPNDLALLPLQNEQVRQEWTTILTANLTALGTSLSRKLVRFV